MEVKNKFDYTEIVIKKHEDGEICLTIDGFGILSFDSIGKLIAFRNDIGNMINAYITMSGNDYLLK